MAITLHHGDCFDILPTIEANSIDSVVTDPPYGLEFMGAKWDAPWKDGWQSGGGFSKPGIGERKTAWPSFSATSKFGAANPTCATCGGRARGAKRCSCETAIWKPIGARKNPENEGLPDDMTGAGMATQMRGYQSWCEHWCAEVYRVMKPGAYMLVFGGTRTSHRVACAIEDAGFEIRDTLMWVYGCLSNDTEIVTKRGIISHTAIEPTDEILCYDKDTGEYRYHCIEEHYEYDIEDTAYRIRSDDTDQIVSRHHRCIIERGGKEIFELAENLQSKENVPILEGLHDLQQALSDNNTGASETKHSVLEGLSTNLAYQSDWHRETVKRAHGQDGVHVCLRQNTLSQYETSEPCETTGVRLQMQWQDTRPGTGQALRQGSCRMDACVVSCTSDQNDWGYQSCMEGRCDLPKPTGQLCVGSLCEMSDRISVDGKKRWLCDGASARDGNANGTMSDSNGMCSSYRPRSTEQSARESNVVRNESGSQVVRKWMGHNTTLATITPVNYKGIVWCVKVPTGAFVAVRHGKAFVTGNSGFPKSLDISKALDKAAGATRTEILGAKAGHEEFIERTDAHSAGGRSEGWERPWRDDPEAVLRSHMQFKPVTEEAIKWQGWGTSLKPSYEPIILARKPLMGTVAQNIVKHGVGGLNIDACRVPIDPAVDDHRLGGVGTWGTEKMAKNVYADYAGDVVTSSPLGRFPANLILDGSEEVMAAFAAYGDKGGGGKPRMTKSNQGRADESQYRIKPTEGTVRDHGDSGTAARFFQTCAWSDDEQANRIFYSSKASAKDRAGSRHPTIKPVSLMRYLCKLVTPPGGLILDLFAGSGTTGQGAVEGGFQNVILIEREADYCADIRNRLSLFMD